MLYWLIPLIVGVALVSVFLYFRVKEKRVIAVIIKGFASLMFVTTALVSWLTSNNPGNTFGVFVLIALCFGLAGDVLLDLKYIIKGKKMLFMSLGFIAFAVGHLFFLLGLFLKLYNFNSNILYLIIPFIVTAILEAGTLLMEKFTPIRYGKMKPFVIVYGIFLFFATSIYFSVAVQSGWQNLTAILMSAGLVFFMLSDLVLNNTYFAPGFTGSAFVITNHVLYYIGQFTIAVSLFFLV